MRYVLVEEYSRNKYSSRYSALYSERTKLNNQDIIGATDAWLLTTALISPFKLFSLFPMLLRELRKYSVLSLPKKKPLEIIQ